MELIRASVNDCDKLWKMQTEAFRDLLEKYQDYEISPASEPREKVEARLKDEFTYFYFIVFEENCAGAVRVVDRKEQAKLKI